MGERACLFSLNIARRVWVLRMLCCCTIATSLRIIVSSILHICSEKKTTAQCSSICEKKTLRFVTVAAPNVTHLTRSKHFTKIAIRFANCLFCSKKKKTHKKKKQKKNKIKSSAFYLLMHCNVLNDVLVHAPSRISLNAQRNVHQEIVMWKSRKLINFVQICEPG